MTFTDQRPTTDSIDQLMPRPRPWWLRLVAAVAVLGAVGYVAYLWGFGYLRPAPGCCGSGSASTTMAATADGDAVMVTAYFFNSSPADLVVTGGSADLPGAEVIGVVPLTEDGDWSVPFETVRFPVLVGGHEHVRLAVIFRPMECPPTSPTGESADGEGGSGLGSAMTVPPEGHPPWGRVTLDLETRDRWIPTLGRAFELDDHLDSGQPNELTVVAASGDRIPADGPALDESCGLLGL
jgi:hypothetical protein